VAYRPIDIAGFFEPGACPKVHILHLFLVESLELRSKGIAEKPVHSIGVFTSIERNHQQAVVEHLVKHFARVRPAQHIVANRSR
jgi:hypothetical protein